jgi:hypothetical protein
MMFVVVLLRRLPFDHVTTCYLLSVESGCCGNRERSKNCDEEPLRTGVPVSEKNQRVLKEGVSALWMNEVLDDGCFSKEVKQLLDGIVSSMRGVKKMMGKG